MKSFNPPEQVNRKPVAVQEKRQISVFISRKRDVAFDDRIATKLAKDLKPLCDDIYLDSLEPAGSYYEDRIEQKLRKADFVIALISADANRSKWVKVELERADSYHKLQGRPVTIPVRLKYDGPYDLRIAAVIQPANEIKWRNYPALLAELKAAIRGDPQTFTRKRDLLPRTRRRWTSVLGLSTLLILGSSVMIFKYTRDSRTGTETQLRWTPTPTIVNSPTPARANVPQTRSATPITQTPIRQTPTDLSSVINELKANGLLQEMQGANDYSRLGDPENMENALQAYRAVFKRQSLKARQLINDWCSNLLSLGDRDYISGHYADALKNYNALFGCLKSRIQE